jgi:hypothetical protein
MIKITEFNYEDWAKATYQSCDDPTEFNGNNISCKLCDKDAENFDEYCENHQRCIVCGENNDCDCEEEMSQISDCCGARMDTDQMLCYDCKDHCESAWDEARDNCRTKTN